MASSSQFQDPVSFFLVLVSLIIAHQQPISLFVRADATEIQYICSLTLEPNVCADCINSDTSRGTNELPDLTHSIIYCAWSQAVLSHNDANLLVQNATGANMKEALQVCDNSLFAASNDFSYAQMSLEASDYKNAMKLLHMAHKDVFGCVNKFQKYTDILIPSNLLDGMVLVKRLNDVARVLMGRLLHAPLA